MKEKEGIIPIQKHFVGLEIFGIMLALCGIIFRIFDFNVAMSLGFFKER
jgi:hypothetical protein